MVVVVASAHPLAGAGEISPAQLEALRFVSLHRSSTVAAVHTILERSGIHWRSLAVVMVRPCGSWDLKPQCLVAAQAGQWSRPLHRSRAAAVVHMSLQRSLASGPARTLWAAAPVLAGARWCRVPLTSTAAARQPGTPSPGWLEQGLLLRAQRGRTKLAWLLPRTHLRPCGAAGGELCGGHEERRPDRPGGRLCQRGGGGEGGAAGHAGRAARAGRAPGQAPAVRAGSCSVRGPRTWALAMHHSTGLQPVAGTLGMLCTAHRGQGLQSLLRLLWRDLVQPHMSAVRQSALSCCACAGTHPWQCRSSWS